MAGNAEEILIERALRVLHTNEDVFFNAGELADKLSISREHFSRVFKKQLGISPYRFIINKKIDQSKLKLRNTSLPIKAISADLGFTSAVQYSTLFKKYTGVTPGRYRNIYRIK